MDSSLHLVPGRYKLPTAPGGSLRKDGPGWEKAENKFTRPQAYLRVVVCVCPVSSWLSLPITPVRAEQLNISSILAGLSPDASLSTHMWSRLKAALSVHKKKTGTQLHPDTHLPF